VIGAIAWLRSFNNAMHFAAGGALLAMLALTIADIAGRTVFNNPVPGTVEVTALLLVVVVFLALAHSEDMGDHITIDLIYVRVGKRARAAMDLFARVLSLGVIGLMAFQIYHFALRQRNGGNESPVLEWPIWPFVLVAAFGAALYTVAIGAKIIMVALGEPAEVEPATPGEVSGPEI
jgi:TRAP-type C4-dicarboxylate transport system permease small subunit